MNKQGTTNRPKEGFTILEVAVASSILMIVFSGFLIGFVQAARLEYLAQTHYAASLIARNRLEHVRTYPYGAVELLSETDTGIDEFGNVTPTGGFRRTTIITTDAVNTNCKKIIVQVWYTSRPGITSPVSVDVSSLMAQ